MKQTKNLLCGVKKTEKPAAAGCVSQRAGRERFRGMRMGRGGFTLLEIMLVVALIAILLGAGIYYMADQADYGREVRVMSDIQSITTSLRLYQASNGSYPTTEQGLDALVTKPTTAPVPHSWRKLFDELPIDPWGTPYFYEAPGRRSGKGFDVFSAGPDRQPGTADDIGNWKESG